MTNQYLMFLILYVYMYVDPIYKSIYNMYHICFVYLLAQYIYYGVAALILAKFYHYSL